MAIKPVRRTLIAVFRIADRHRRRAVRALGAPTEAGAADKNTSNPLRTKSDQRVPYAVEAALRPSAAWAAASRAIGTRKGEQET